MDIKAPTFPESIADGSIAQWHHQEGAFVNKDDLLVDIETCLLYTSDAADE